MVWEDHAYKDFSLCCLVFGTCMNRDQLWWNPACFVGISQEKKVIKINDVTPESANHSLPARRGVTVGGIFQLPLEEQLADQMSKWCGIWKVGGVRLWGELARISSTEDREAGRRTEWRTDPGAKSDVSKQCKQRARARRSRVNNCLMCLHQRRVSGIGGCVCWWKACCWCAAVPVDCRASPQTFTCRCSCSSNVIVKASTMMPLKWKSTINICA